MLGFAFKADTGDTRESAAITLVRDFIAENAFVNIYDPQVRPEQIWMDLEEANTHLSSDDSVLHAFLYSLFVLRTFGT